MATTSVVITVVRKIVELLQAAGDLATVQVLDSKPTSIQRETIYFAGASAVHSYVVMRAGRLPRDEDSELRWAIDARKPGQSPVDAYLRAIALYAHVENTIADDPTLGNLVQWCQAAGFELGENPNGEGWDGLLTARIVYKARLT